MNTKSILHWFWVWQDEKEEAWLQEMARQGWHLKGIGAFGTYKLAAGEPREMAYRLDFFTDSKNKANYLKIFDDAGWEYIGEFGSWQYFRKPIQDGEVPEIFTDNESKIVKYGRILTILIVLLPIYSIMLTRVNQAERYFGEGVTFIVFLVFFVFYLTYIYAMLKLIGRISQLKRNRR